MGKNLIYIISDEENLSKNLKVLFEENSLVVSVVPTRMALEAIVNFKPSVAICINSLSNQENLGAAAFIIKASQLKVFQHTSFALLDKEPMNEMLKIQGMTLGYSLVLNQDLSETDRISLINFINAEIAYLNAA